MAKYLVISDVHGHIEPLKKVLETVQNYDEIWFMGDVIGHDENLKPEDYLECYSLLYEHQDKVVCIAGNWEYWLFHPERDQNPKLEQYQYRNYLPIKRVEMENAGLLDWVAKWPEKSEREQFTLIHGSPYSYRDPDFLHAIETYILPQDGNFVSGIFQRKIATPHLLFTHTHEAGYFKFNSANVPVWNSLQKKDIDQPYKYNGLDHRIHFAINPGSISQNRKINQGDAPVDPQRTALVIDTVSKEFTFIEVK